MLDLNRLNVFIHVAATQSCSDAAKRLHLSQPTVSKHIQNLEAELNVKLFDREGAQLRITNAGMTLLPWARKHGLLFLVDALLPMTGALSF